jgi:hypothetical protein
LKRAVALAQEQTKYLAQSNKSPTAGKATKKCEIRQPGLIRYGNDTTAYYTDNLEDAVNAAVVMARQRAL